MKNPIISRFSMYLYVAMIWLMVSCSSTKHLTSQEQDSYEWAVVKVDKDERPTWTIYSRKIAGTAFLEYKIEGPIASSATACLSIFKQDILDLAHGVKQEKDLSTYDLLAESSNELTTYVIHNEPFPLKDTEMSVRYLFVSEANGHAGVKWREAWEDCPIQPSKKLSRVQTFRGSIDFSPTSSTSCQAVQSVSFDPKKMPLWLVEPMVFKFLKKGLQDIRETASTSIP